MKKKKNQRVIRSEEKWEFHQTAFEYLMHLNHRQVVHLLC